MKTQRNKQFWLGVDLAKRTLAVGIAPLGARTWHTLPTAAFAHTPEGVAELVAWVRRQLGRSGVLAGVVAEATGRLAERFAAAWAGAGSAVRVSVCNPARTAAFIKSQGVRDKRDASDAALLALYGVQQQPAPAAALEPARGRLRELDRLREQLQQDRTRWRNRLQDALDAVAHARIESILGGLDEELARLETELKGAVQADPVLTQQCALLQSMPGIGPVCARTLLAELGDLGASDREKLVARAGLYPLAEQSGSSLHKRPRLAKGGGARVRRVLYMAATSLWRVKRGGAWEVAQRLCARGRANMIAMGAMMRKLLLQARAVLKSGQPYNAEQANRRQPLRRNRRQTDGFTSIGEVLKKIYVMP